MTLEPRQPRTPAYPRRITAADTGRRLLPWLRGLVTPSICLLLLLLAPAADGAEPGSSQRIAPGSSEMAATPCKGKVALPDTQNEAPPCLGKIAPSSPPPCAGAPVPNPPEPQDPPPPCTGIVAPPPCKGDAPGPITEPPPCSGEIAVPLPRPVPPVPPPPATILFRDVSLGAFCADPKSWLALQVRMRGTVRRMSDPDYPGGGFVLEDGTSIGSALARAPLVGGLRESDHGPATIEGRVIQVEGRNPLTGQSGTWYAISVDRVILEQR